METAVFFSMPDFYSDRPQPVLVFTSWLIGILVLCVNHAHLHAVALADLRVRHGEMPVPRGGVVLGIRLGMNSNFMSM